MRTASGFRAACLALGLALLGSGCLIPQRDAGGNGVRGGTLQVLSGGDIIGMDTAINYTPEGLAIARTYARTLYGYNLAGPPEQQTVPVPDIALTLSFATLGSDRFAAARKPIEESLARAEIDLKTNLYERDALYEKSLSIPAKRLKHQLGHTAWCPDFLPWLSTPDLTAAWLDPPTP